MTSTPARFTPRSRVKREDGFELFEVFFRVQARVAVGARRLQQSFALVQAQCLRVDVVLLRHRADHVIGLAARFLHLLGRCFVVNPAELPQQLLRALVEHLRKHDSDFDDEVAPLAAPRRRRPSPSDVKPLPGLRARRHAQTRRAVGRRHVNLGAERRFVHADGHGDVKVVPFAHERLVRLDLDGQIEIARRGRAAPPRFPSPAHGCARRRSRPRESPP